MNWWDLGEWSGTGGSKLATYQINCAFCGERGNFETVAHLERQKPGGRKVLNYDTLKVRALRQLHVRVLVGRR